MPDSRRISDLRNFYELLGSLAESGGGARTLAACSGQLKWPQRGVYFFMEDGEVRSERHWPAHSTRWHPCADQRLRNEAMEPAEAASRSEEDRRRQSPRIDFQVAGWNGDHGA